MNSNCGKQIEGESELIGLAAHTTSAKEHAPSNAMG